MTALVFPDKDTDEVLDYVVDWSDRLATGDVIVSSDWTVPAGITQDSATFADTTTTIWLSGGTGTRLQLLNRVVTNLGRTMDQTCEISIKEK